MDANAPTGSVARGGSRLMLGLRWPIVALWLATAVAVAVLLPSLGGAGASPLEDVVPTDSPSMQAAQRSTAVFGAPAATDVVIVQRDPSGLSTRALSAHALAAKRAIEHPDRNGILGAVPLANLPLPGVHWNESSTTALTYVFMAPQLSLNARLRAAKAYQLGLVPEGHTGVTGAGPARLAQFGVIQDALPIVTVATVLVILLMVFLYFRSLLAPLVTLGTAALAYLVAIHALAGVAELIGAHVPQEVEPLLVVLLLGLVTDYSVFFLAEGRRRLLLGDERLPAAREAFARTGPMVVAAGLIVACSCAALLAGKLDFFRVFGPGMALCALVVTLVSVTLVPALLGILGPRLYGRAVREAEPPDPTTGEFRAIEAPDPVGFSTAQRERVRRRFAGWFGAVRAARRTAIAEGGSPARAVAGRLAATRPAALVIAVVCVAGLGWAAREDLGLELGVSYVRALPASTEARTAGDDATRGFGPGILAPTEILVEQAGVAGRRDALAAVEHEIRGRDGVGIVIGPAEQAEQLPPLLVSKDGDAARFIVLMDGDPTAADAIDTAQSLHDDLPAMLRRAGLPAGARVSLGGESALAAETVSAVDDDTVRIAIALAVVTLVLLALFLRALVAPFALLAAGALGYLAALGLTALACRALFGEHQLSYYVPLVGLVLLFALGSDYNVLVAGRIRAESRRRRLREAIAVAAPQASRAVSVAGITLAATFALLAFVPLRPFRELAILLAIGVLVDALLVRPLLIPALISLLGRAAWWPARAIRTRPATAIVDRVARLSGRSPDEARAMTRATLCTLGERIGAGQAQELGAHLPPELADVLDEPDGCAPFPYDEFVARVAERQGVSVQAAARDVGAVMATLREVVPEAELDYVRAALSEDYRPLLGDVQRGDRFSR
jgi:RND superfamily putative drug exporter